MAIHSHTHTEARSDRRKHRGKELDVGLLLISWLPECTKLETRKDSVLQRRSARVFMI